jgi:cobalt-zinc-cadmium efflux system outer membrane protein
MFTGTLRCAALLALAYAMPSAAEGLTEKEVLQRFIEQSPHARELRARVAATKAEFETRSLFPNPNFTYSRESAGFTEFFEAQQTLPITGRLGYLRKAAIAGVGASEAEARFVLWGLRSDVRQAFYAVVRAQEREAVLQRAISEIDSIKRILTAREKEGESSKFDRLRAEREAAELRAEQAIAATLTVQARSILLAFLPQGSQSFVATGTLTGPPAVSPAELVEQAFRSRGDYRAEESQIKRFQLEQTAAGRLRFPEPIVSAGLKRADNARGDTASGPVVSLTLPLPLFNRGTTEVSRFRAEEDRARARKDTLQQQIAAQVEGAYQTLLLRQRAVESYVNELSSANTELTEIARIAYQEGELGVLELLDAHRVNRQSQLRLLDLRTSAKEALIELERVVGEEVEK